MRRLLAWKRSVEQSAPSDLAMEQKSPFSTFRTFSLDCPRDGIDIGSDTVLHYLYAPTGTVPVRAG